MENEPSIQMNNNIRKSSKGHKFKTVDNLFESMKDLSSRKEYLSNLANIYKNHQGFNIKMNYTNRPKQSFNPMFYMSRGRFAY